MRHFRWFAGITLACLVSGPALAVTRYVSTVGNDTTGDGSTGNPYLTIQKAIDQSALSGDIVELADGIYTGTGNVNINYVGKAVIVRSTSGSPQACVVDGQNTAVGFQFLSGEPAGAVLEGITVQNCVMQGLPDGEGRGGAIRIEGTLSTTSPTIRNCIFKNNAAIGGNTTFFANQPVNGFGGAIYAFNSTSIITNCSFANNSATGGNDMFYFFYAGIGGGGAVGGQNANLKFVGCSFGGNSSVGGIDGVNPPVARGGAVFIQNGSATFEGCTFTQNASGTGGGAYVYNGSLSAVNTLFVMNTASEDGAGAAAELAGLTLANCSLAGNVATNNGGGAFVNGGAGPNLVVNSVLWDNTAGIGGSGFASSGAPAALFAYSVVQSSGGSALWTLAGATDGGSNLDTDPGFLRDPGTLSVSDLGDLRLQSASVCVDSGSNALIPSLITLDLDGEDRVFNLIVDRGAYEFHVSPQQLINDLKASIDALVAGGATLPAQGRGLKATLNVALLALNNGYPQVAITTLNVFKIEVNVLVLVRRLTRAQGNALIADAQEIIDLIN